MATPTTTAADGPAPARARPAAERLAWLWDAFAALTLVVPTVLALAAAPSAAHATVTAALAVGLAAWHWLTALRQPAWAETSRMLLWLAGVLVLTWLLLGRHESYLFLVYGLYPQLFGRLGRWTVPGVVALVLVVFGGTGVLTRDPQPDAILGVAGSVLLALVIGFFVNALVRATAEREAAMDALEATRAELAETARRAGMLAERERLARDLHDTIAQGFTGIVMQLEAAEQALAGDAEAAAAHLERARQAARGSLGELRSTVHALRPADLDGAGLPEALDRVARRWSQDTGVPADSAVDGAPRPLPPDVEVALLRTAQEGLANIARHAGAGQVGVRLSYEPDRVALSIADDGVGFDPGAASGGRGLAGLAERLGALGGGLTVDSAPGSGTRLRAGVPAP